ncbi:MAG: hypothetical protein IPL65_22525 [Lewinellaceae bacterium]|nr:hypothetical protein [Lewinellaceae bacterium]
MASRKYPTGLGTVHISLPAAVAGNINSLSGSLKEIAEQLGCPKCVSGYNCRFQLEKDYLFDPAAKKLQKVAIADQSAFAAPTVRVNVGARSSYNLDSVIASVRKIAELTGHTACATGCNLFFERFQDRMFNISNTGRINELKYSAGL